MFSKPTKLINPLNQEVWWCVNVSEVKVVDGIEYVTVYKSETPSRSHLMRKDALRKVT
jgi:hypothetical protein